MGLGVGTNDGIDGIRILSNVCKIGKDFNSIAGNEGTEDIFSKMGPNSRFWSHFAHSGLILILLAKMLKSPNEENGVFCPPAATPLSHCLPTAIFCYLLIFQQLTISWSHFYINFYKQMYAGDTKYFRNM